MTWAVVFSKQAQKDAGKAAAAGLKEKITELLEVLEVDPFQRPPNFEKLVGDLAGAYSRRINIQHRLVYQVFVAERTVRVLRIGLTTSSRRAAAFERQRLSNPTASMTV